jgi:exodeoxyribonuclease VII large subunit
MARQLYANALEPVWFGDRKVYSVTGLVEGVRSRIVDLPSFWVHGEISNFNYRAGRPMIYFTLKDPENGYTLNCVLGRSRYDALGIPIKDGDSVQVFGRPDIYAPFGSFQLQCQTIEHAGRGLLMQRLEALKEKLAGEGLFDASRKQPLPTIPRRIGLITGAEAAAKGDFLRNVHERYPLAKLVVCETLVQGDRAAPLLVAALRTMERVEDIDVIVISRGGGAFEHFLPFSDERLCRAIAACPKPVVSAIGHEKDSPLSDLVADLRCSTPTAAARTVVPDYHELTRRLNDCRSHVRTRVQARHQFGINRVLELRDRLTRRSPSHIVDDRRLFLRDLLGRGRACSQRRMEEGARTNERLAASLMRALKGRHHMAGVRQTAAYDRLRALAPGHTLARGYAIVRRKSDDAIVRSGRDAPVGDDVTIMLAQGALAATVTEAETK